MEQLSAGSALRPEASDGELVARARDGDRSAFAELVGRHYDFVFRTACKWCGNRPDAEDVAQEVSVKLAVAIRGFDGRSAFTSWLYRVTLNAVRDMQRAAGRSRRKFERYAEIHPEVAAPEQEEAAAVRELWAAVRALPEKQRDAVLLVYAEEMSHARAGEIMGCREATVSWHIHEAKKALRGLL